MRSAHSEAPYLSKNGYNYNNPLRFIILTLPSHCMTFPNFFLKTGPDHCATVKLQRHDSPWVATWFDLLLPKEKKVKLKANAFKSKIKEKRKLSSHLSPGVNVAINIKYGYNGEVYFIQQGCHVGVLPVLGNNLKSGLALNTNFINCCVACLRACVTFSWFCIWVGDTKCFVIERHYDFWRFKTSYLKAKKNFLNR